MWESRRKRLYILVTRREKNIVPIAGEAAGRQAGESVTFADEVGLIEVAQFVDNVGPRPARSIATGDQRSVEPDRSCEQFWRHPDLCGKPALKLACAEARLSNDGMDPRPAPDSDQPARGEADRVVRAEISSIIPPNFRRRLRALESPAPRARRHRALADLPRTSWLRDPD